MNMNSKKRNNTFTIFFITLFLLSCSKEIQNSNCIIMLTSNNIQCSKKLIDAVDLFLEKYPYTNSVKNYEICIDKIGVDSSKIIIAPMHWSKLNFIGREPMLYFTYKDRKFYVVSGMEDYFETDYSFPKRNFSQLAQEDTFKMYLYDDNQYIKYDSTRYCNWILKTTIGIAPPVPEK